jgi:hypothetical protein
MNYIKISVARFLALLQKSIYIDDNLLLFITSGLYSLTNNFIFEYLEKENERDMVMK